jgi:secreted trypsin-like serine protease
LKPDSFPLFTDRMLCACTAPNVGGAGCLGDSGGPIIDSVTEKQEIGVVSWGDPSNYGQPEKPEFCANKIQVSVALSIFSRMKFNLK